jgi:hypothetical protein
MILAIQGRLDEEERRVLLRIESVGWERRRARLRLVPLAARHQARARRHHYKARLRAFPA